MGVTRRVLQSSAQAVINGNVNSVGAGLLDALGATDKLINLKWVFWPLILR
jgi:hypothetical protein